MIETPHAALKDGPSGLLAPARPGNSVAALGDATRVRAGSIGSGPVATTPPTRQGCFPCVPPGVGATIAAMVERVLLASPRGYCAGVERAVETVELALDHYGPPVYVRKQIVHNIHVVRDLEARGAIFVDSEAEAPEGATIVYSAHGVAPSVNAASAELGHNVIDADLPARDEGARAGAPVRRRRLHGRPDRPCRPRGGRRDDGRGARRRPCSSRTSPRRRRSTCRPDARLAYITQTTLSVDETSEIIAVLRRRFPAIHAPKKEDICYATSNRQWAVKEMLTEVDLLLVIGSRNSSNSNRLVDVARAGGVASYLIDDETEIDEAWLDGVRHRRRHLGRVGAGEARQPRLRLVPRARGRADRAVPDGRRGRHLPAAGRAAPRARARRVAVLGRV